MTEKKEYSGLCANCIHAAECGYRIKHTKPILFCEEFEYKKGEPSKKSLPKYKSDKIDEENNKYNGLCANCENREICPPNKVKSNVTFCEDYK